ncbi:hypothetical protein Y032_0016g2996 [Ancylostoma ceylanicum]|nr:hypothetical protein Y032_0016g2996 [Ancylostoma ceylanicum]
MAEWQLFSLRIEQIELDYNEDPHSPRSDTSEMVIVNKVTSEEITTNESQRIAILEEQLDQLKQVILRELPHLDPLLNAKVPPQEVFVEGSSEKNEDKPPILKRVSFRVERHPANLPSAAENATFESDQSNGNRNRNYAEWRPMCYRFNGELGLSDSCRNVTSSIQRADIAQRDHLCSICLKPHEGTCRKQLKCIYCDKSDHHRALCGTTAAYEGRGELAHHC